MKYIPIILVLSFFTLGCIEASPYKEVSPSQLSSGTFEGEKVCMNGILENNNISGISLGNNLRYEDGTFVNACGTFKAGRIDAEFINPLLSVSAEKEVYHSNETLKVRVGINSTEAGKGRLAVTGIKNEFGRELINETKEMYIEKGLKEFDFEFKTPSCEECSSLKPGTYFLNATLIIRGKTFEAYNKIKLEREK